MEPDNKVNQLLNEDASSRKDCNLCNEVSLEVGQRAPYGSVIIYKIGDSKENGWFATLSPRTGGDPKNDFTIQLMPFAHLTHFSQISSYPELAKNYGIAFSKLCLAMTKVMAENHLMEAEAALREKGMAIATYGKCTTWKEKKEHLHIKIFQFRGDLGQPSTVDSSFGRKELHKDHETGDEFIKMKPIKKLMIGEKRFKELSNKLISLLK